MLRELAEVGVEHVVVGGAAAILQGAPIFTGDLDMQTYVCSASKG